MQLLARQHAAPEQDLADDAPAASETMSSGVLPVGSEPLPIAVDATATGAEAKDTESAALPPPFAALSGELQPLSMDSVEYSDADPSGAAEASAATATGDSSGGGGGGGGGAAPSSLTPLV
jgi:hypothetical protein